MKPKLVFSWSGGKDCALALSVLQKTGDFEITGLLTTVSQEFDRISMHGVRTELLRRQASALGIPLTTIALPRDCPGTVYETLMGEALTRLKALGVSAVGFGDLFLEDLRAYREAKMDSAGMQAVFPLWKRDTKELPGTMYSEGFRSVITCVDTKVLDKEYAGEIFGPDFCATLPSGIDPCGENGEFHSFVFEAPNFCKKIGYEVGEKVLRDDRFYFCDLLPV